MAKNFLKSFIKLILIFVFVQPKLLAQKSWDFKCGQYKIIGLVSMSEEPPYKTFVTLFPKTKSEMNLKFLNLTDDSAALIYLHKKVLIKATFLVKPSLTTGMISSLESIEHANGMLKKDLFEMMSEKKCKVFR